MPDQPSRRIFLFGDRVNDEYILPLARRGGYGEQSGLSEDWENHEQWIRMSRQGGVSMTRDMLSWYFGLSEIVVAEVQTDAPALTSLARLGNCDCCDVSGRAKAFRQVDATSKQNFGALKLRVERFEGYFRDIQVGDLPPVLFKLSAGGEAPDAIIINDAGTDLRRSREGDKNDFFTLMTGLEKNRTDILLKMHLPLATGLAWKLFKQANDNARSRIVIVSADDLRLGSGEAPQLRGTPIARCPSWDRIIEDLNAARKEGGSLLSTLTENSDALVVLFDVEGAAVVRGTAVDPEISLIFDPMCAEGEMAHVLPGDMVGKMNCFLASLADKYVATPETVKGRDLVSCVEDALLDARLYAEGHFLVDRRVKGGELYLEYPPVRELRKMHEERIKGAETGQGYPKYRVLHPKLVKSKAQLLAHALRAAGDTSEVDENEFIRLAKRVVTDGVETTLEGLPHGRFGKLWTVDRDEIEGLRAVNTLIRKYLDNPSDAKPLSIAVFGPPGAGKSFGVRQLVDEETTPVLEFNMSQVEEDQLPGFFHMIRDKNLEQKTPLCFFDEFDSRNLSLLKNFLAPMQDGRFLEDQTLRPIGRGIFVFAGGTSETFKDFEKDIGPEPAPNGARSDRREASTAEKDDEAARKHAKTVKKADFISRLRGSYDVKGPNPHGKRTGDDPAHYIRRAILLRRMLEIQLPGIISQADNRASIEPELLNALLRVKHYRHGTRSMELLVQALARGRSGASVGRSDLPIDGQIEMLVDLVSWKELLNRA